MDREYFNAIITRYLEKFDYTNSGGHDEFFKWQAIDCFQRNWDIDAVDLKGSFEKAIKEVSVLLDGAHSAPSSGIKALLELKDEVETVREAFRALFEEEDNLGRRDVKVSEFISTINARIKAHWSTDSYKPQTTRAALCYLALNDPKRNFFYMFRKAENWARYTEYGFDLGSGGSFSLPDYYGMCEELVKEIKADERLQECNRKRMEKAGINECDDDFHTLAYDIIYCTSTYNLYVDIPTSEAKSVKQRVERSKDRAALEALLQKKLQAEKELAAFDTSLLVQPELEGKAVTHFKFGKGIITAVKDDTATIQFGAEKKSLMLSGTIENKYMSLDSATETEQLQQLAANKKEKDRLEKALKAATEAYNKAKTAFDAKWVKKVLHETISQDDD